VFVDPFSSSRLWRRDAAQRLLLHVGIPSFGRSHWVNNKYAAKNAMAHPHSGILKVLPL
jgi:hypothetical protein